MLREPEDVNELRRLLQSGAIAPEDLASIIPGGENALAQILQQDQMPAPNYNIAPMPQNAMRFESGPDAGRVVPLDFGGGPQAPQRMKVAGYGNDGIMSDLGATDQAPVALDYSRPAVDTAKGRGYYGKDGAVYVKGPDGSMTKILQGYDREASYKAEKRDFERRKGESELARGKADLEHQQEVTEGLRAQRSIKEDPTSQVALEKRFGKAEKDMRWRADGTLEPIPGGQKLQDASDVNSLLEQAEPLLDTSTGSYIGAGVDQLERVVGMSNPGAEAAARLKALQGALVSKMPKMSGPQSDNDVQLYREMAGQIGDSTIPAEQKRAAMQTIRDINSRYQGMNTPAIPPSQKSRAIFDAKKAIDRGAPRDKVIQRLEQSGIRDHGL